MNNEKLNELNKKIKELIQERNNTLNEIRKSCTHLRLVELDASPPQRLCMDCGAEERGWACGYQELTLLSEQNNKGISRGIYLKTSVPYEFYSYRKDGPLYCIGQSAENFFKF
jgi:hypothetical protein